MFMYQVKGYLPVNNHNTTLPLIIAGKDCHGHLVIQEVMKVRLQSTNTDGILSL